MKLRSRYLPEGWYPGSAVAVRRDIEGFEAYLSNFKIDLSDPQGGVAPHAGWYFSGRLASLVFHLCSAKKKPDVVAVFGGHMGPGPGLAYADEAWETPLGPIRIDQPLTQALVERAGLRIERGSTNDNTVEIQMPLVKYYFPDSRLLALRAPHSREALDIGREAAELAQAQGKTLLAFASTDLTHYGPNYGFSPHGLGEEAVTWVKGVNDKGFIDRTLRLDGEGLLEHAARNSSACSAGAVAAAAAACRAMGSTGGVLADYFTSYDVMPGDSFVGYAGIIFQPG